MSGLALVAVRLGAEVSGSDRNESSYLERVRRSGATVFLGHDADNLPSGADVVISTAIADENPELAAAREGGHRVLHRSDLLSEFSSEKRTIAVAGTLLTYLTSYVTQTDFGQWTPAVVACWSVVANALRQAVGKLSEGEGDAGVSR